MKLTQAQELLFGSNIGELASSLGRLAYCIDPRFGPGREYPSFKVEKTMGSMASRGVKVVFSSGIAPEGGGQQYRLNINRRGVTIDDTLYGGYYPDLDTLLDRFAEQATSIDQSTRFVFVVGSGAVSVAADHSVFLHEGKGFLGSVEMGCTSGRRRTVGETLDDENVRPLDSVWMREFKSNVSALPDLARLTTRPYAQAFIEAVGVIAPGVVLAPAKSEV